MSTCRLQLGSVHQLIFIAGQNDNPFSQLSERLLSRLPAAVGRLVRRIVVVVDMQPFQTWPSRLLLRLGYIPACCQHDDNWLAECLGKATAVCHLSSRHGRPQKHAPHSWCVRADLSNPKAARLSWVRSWQSVKGVLVCLETLSTRKWIRTH